MKMYDIVSGSKRLPSSYFLSKQKALKQFPMLNAKDLAGAIVYYDGKTTIKIRLEWHQFLK